MTLEYLKSIGCRRKQGFVIRQDDDGPSVVVLQHQREKVAAFMQRHRIRSIEINYSFGFRHHDLSFLADIRDLESINIVMPHRTCQMPPLASFSKLRAIGTRSYIRGGLDFTGCKRLVGCCVRWQPGVETLFGCTRLQSLCLLGIQADRIPQLHQLHRLRSLALDGGRLETLACESPIASLRTLECQTQPRLQSLDGLRCYPQLRRFELGWAPKIRSLEGIGHAHQIRDIELRCLRALRELEDIAQLSSLRKLLIVDVPRMRSLSFLERCRELRDLRVVGNCRIEDGDLRFVQRSRKLRYGFVQPSRKVSYAPSAQEVNAGLFLYRDQDGKWRRGEQGKYPQSGL